MSDLKKESIKGIKWSFVENISVHIVTFILGLIMARLLEPADFGVVGMLSIFFAISQSLVNCGFSNALIRKNDRKEIDFSTVFIFNIIVGLCCYLILYVSAPYIATFFNNPILEKIVRVLSLTIVIDSFCTIPFAKLTIDVNFKSRSKATFFSALISSIVGIFLAYNGFGVWSIVYQMLASRIFTVVLLWYIVRWMPKTGFSWSSFKPMFAYGSNLMLSGLIQTLYSNITTLLIGKVYTPEVLGYYTRGNSIANLPSRNITDVLKRVTFPIFSKIQDDKKRLIAIYRKYICLSSLCIMFLMTLLATESEPLILILLTDKWSSSIIYLQIFCFVMMFDHVNILNLNLLQVIGRSDLCLKLQIIKKTISLILLFVSIPYGAIAVCSVLILYVQIAIIINTYYTGKIFGLGYFTQFKDFFKYFICSIIACAPSFVLTYVIKNPWINISCGSLLAMVIYCVILWNDENKKEVFNVLRKIIR